MSKKLRLFLYLEIPYVICIIYFTLHSINKNDIFYSFGKGLRRKESIG
jgi:hypothetical protein